MEGQNHEDKTNNEGEGFIILLSALFLMILSFMILCMLKIGPTLRSIYG